ALPGLYGDASVLETARKALPPLPAITQALDELSSLASHIERLHPEAHVQFDLADSQGYSYYSGMRFAIYLRGGSDALVRGGRYDEVGAAFGRTRPAVGFSLDVKALARHTQARPLREAIHTQWQTCAEWQAAVQTLRQAGETVVVTLPGQDHTPEEFRCTRVLALHNGQWQVQTVCA
ncbi:MAG: ATP phosphoribosyltransferase regulatory subunit, partial [Brachymonas sp.]|nr:ATP phosphoribosyltransferase regulatory subunit [Brachymonas sp.]